MSDSLVKTAARVAARKLIQPDGAADTFADAVLAAALKPRITHIAVGENTAAPAPAETVLSAAQERGEAVKKPVVNMSGLSLEDSVMTVRFAYEEHGARELEVVPAELARTIIHECAAPVAAAGMKVEPFVVKHYSSDERPCIKGNGFDGLTVGDERWEAEEFVDWLNARLAPTPAAPVDEQTELEVWLVKRIAWLDYEMKHGGSYEHLSVRHNEADYILKHLQAARAQRRGDK